MGVNSAKLNSAISLYYAKGFLAFSRPVASDFRYAYAPNFVDYTLSGFGSGSPAVPAFYCSSKFVRNYIFRAAPTFAIFAPHATLVSFMNAYALSPKVYNHLAVPLKSVFLARHGEQEKQTSVFEYFFKYDRTQVYRALFFCNFFNLLVSHKTALSARLIFYAGNPVKDLNILWLLTFNWLNAPAFTDTKNLTPHVWQAAQTSEPPV